MVGPRFALVVGLLFALNISVFAQDRAILYPGAGVELNGKMAQTTSAVSSGDTVTTATGAAQIIEKGATIQVEPRTSVKYGNSISLECGGVSVNGNSTVHVNNNTIVPSGASPRFEVTNREGKVLVSVKSGAVLVGGETVSAGQTISRPGTPGCVAADPVAKASGGHMGKAVAAGGAGAGVVAGTCLAWWCGDKNKDEVSHSKR